MIILDTNVLSELLRPEPNPAVVRYIDALPRASVHVASVSQAEILHGIAAMPEGRKRTALAAMAQAMFDHDFSGRVLPFDGAAAACYAHIMVARRDAGRRIEAFDALIAATALSVGAGVATRDLGRFEGCGLAVLVDPWTA